MGKVKVNNRYQRQVSSPFERLLCRSCPVPHYRLRQPFADRSQFGAPHWRRHPESARHQTAKASATTSCGITSNPRRNSRALCVPITLCERETAASRADCNAARRVGANARRPQRVSRQAVWTEGRMKALRNPSNSAPVARHFRTATSAITARRSRPPRSCR